MWHNYQLEIVYHDQYLIAINKPSGLLVHKSMIDKHEIYFAMKLLRNQIDAWVYPIHRLDKPTSGVLLFALDSNTARLMSEQFKTHDVKKTYVAIVRGFVKDNGVIEHALSVKLDKIADKDTKADKEDQDAMTAYQKLATVELPYATGRYETTRYSLVALSPKTGRKHQLRRHMKHISHHILGDTKYGRGEHNTFIRETYNCHRLLLHANSLTLTHPYTHEKLTLNAPFDEMFLSLFKHFNWKTPH